jgi:hypothetical protein
MAKVMRTCVHCGRPTTRSCSMCGRPVCERCAYFRGPGQLVCYGCSGGKGGGKDVLPPGGPGDREGPRSME